MRSAALKVIRPLTASGLGRLVDGSKLDLSKPLTPEVAQELKSALVEGKGLLCLRFGRKLDDEELMRTSVPFGELEVAPGMIDGIGRAGIHPTIQNDVTENASKEEQIAAFRTRGVNPLVAHISNVDMQTNEINAPKEFALNEWEWHTDMSYMRVPPTITGLHCHEKPASGGANTNFSSVIEAYEVLPRNMKEKVHKLNAKHDSTYASSGIIRPGMTVPANPVAAIGQVHPIVRYIPEYGTNALFLGRRTNGYVMDLPLQESEELLDSLWAYTIDGGSGGISDSGSSGDGAGHNYSHEWEVGDLVFWDNRVLLHFREPFNPSERRIMKRTQIVGEPVLPAQLQPEAAAQVAAKL